MIDDYWHIADSQKFESYRLFIYRKIDINVILMVHYQLDGSPHTFALNIADVTILKGELPINSDPVGVCTYAQKLANDLIEKRVYEEGTFYVNKDGTFLGEHSCSHVWSDTGIPGGKVWCIKCDIDKGE